MSWRVARETRHDHSVLFCLFVGLLAYLLVCLFACLLVLESILCPEASTPYNFGARKGQKNVSGRSTSFSWGTKVQKHERIVGSYVYGKVVTETKYVVLGFAHLSEEEEEE